MQIYNKQSLAALASTIESKHKNPVTKHTQNPLINSLIFVEKAKTRNWRWRQWHTVRQPATVVAVSQMNTISHEHSVR